MVGTGAGVAEEQVCLLLAPAHQAVPRSRSLVHAFIAVPQHGNFLRLYILGKGISRGQCHEGSTSTGWPPAAKFPHPPISPQLLFKSPIEYGRVMCCAVIYC